MVAPLAREAVTTYIGGMSPPTAASPVSAPNPFAAMDARSISLGMKRGVRRLCPACAKGPMFAGYLKVNDRCPTCGHDLSHYRADDGPAYFTILLVGHLVVAPLFALSVVKSWSPILLMLVGLPLTAAAALSALPFIKGAWIGLLWGTGGHDEAQTQPIEP